MFVKATTSSRLPTLMVRLICNTCLSMRHFAETASVILAMCIAVKDQDHFYPHLFDWQAHLYRRPSNVFDWGKQFVFAIYIFSNFKLISGIMAVGYGDDALWARLRHSSGRTPALGWQNAADRQGAGSAQWQPKRSSNRAEYGGLNSTDISHESIANWCRIGAPAGCRYDASAWRSATLRHHFTIRGVPCTSLRIIRNMKSMRNRFCHLSNVSFCV